VSYIRHFMRSVWTRGEQSKQRSYFCS